MLTAPVGSVADRRIGAATAHGAAHFDKALFDKALFDRPLFAGLEDEPAIVLAVSGGPDSMALMLLVARWADTLGAAAPALHVATVDHGLRAESRAEATFVERAADALGLPHAILTWREPKPASRLQERARAARYSLLAAHAGRVGASRVLTAHHADDQAETILLRLGRGSGLAGLAGMRRDRRLAPGLMLTRPLLACAKDELIALCRGETQAFVDDPSNADPAYARTRLRARTGALTALGLDRTALLRLGRRMARAELALDAETVRVEALLAPVLAEGLYRARLPASPPPAEILLRLVRRGIEHVAPGRSPIRLDRLEALTHGIATALEGGAVHRATLGGARITLGRDRFVTFIREAPRRNMRILPDPEAEAR